MSDSGPGRERAVQLVRSWFEDYWNRGDEAILDAVMHEGCVHHNVTTPVRQDRDGWRVELAAMRAAVPDIRFEIRDLLVEGNRVAVRWTMSGRHTGDALGFPATDRPFSVEGMGFAVIEHGKFTLVEEMWDSAGFLAQLGKT